jgi:plastocyanin
VRTTKVLARVILVLFGLICVVGAVTWNRLGVPPPWDLIHAYVNPDEATQDKTGSSVRAELVATGVSLFGVFVQALGGVVLLWGLSYTAQTLRTTEEGQFADRFTKAVDQIGARSESGQLSSLLLEKRLGGIYALERIARDSERYYWSVMEVLTGYLRVNHPNLRVGSRRVAPTPAPWSEVGAQAVLKVLRDRQHHVGHRQELRPLNLSQLDLTWGELEGAHLEGVDLRSSNLESVNLIGASLGPFDGSPSRLEEAILSGALLRGADLTKAHLDDANFTDADLSGAWLRKADLTGAILGRAELRRANLRGARGLTQAQIDQAYMDVSTILPRSTDPSGTPLQRSNRPAPHVHIRGGQFVPPTLTVPAGTTVTWINHDRWRQHAPTSESGAFAAAPLRRGETFRRQFSTPGTYTYRCTQHPRCAARTARIIVT